MSHAASSVIAPVGLSSLPVGPRRGSGVSRLGVRPLRHTDHLVGSSHPAENMKRFQIGLMKRFAEGRACVADDHDCKIAIRSLASRGTDTDVGNNARNDNAVDTSPAQLFRKIRCRKGSRR